MAARRRPNDAKNATARVGDARDAAAPHRTPPKRRQWLTTPEMARLLDMHPKTLLKYAKACRVPDEFICPLGNGRFRWRADFANHPVFLRVPLA